MLGGQAVSRQARTGFMGIVPLHDMLLVLLPLALAGVSPLATTQHGTLLSTSHIVMRYQEYGS